MKKKSFPYLIAGAVAVICFCLFLIINHFTPIMYDDLRYGALGRTIAGIFHTQCQDYFTFNGRVFSHALAMFYSGILPKWLFNIVNALCVTVMVWLICVMAKVKVCRSLWGNVLFTLSFFLCWFVLPDQFTTLFEICGSSNYIWATIWNLSFICLYLKLRKDPSVARWQWPLICLFSFLAGTWTEFFAVAVGPAVGLSIIINKEWKPKTIIPTIAYAVGGAFDFFAPSNFARLEHESSHPALTSWAIDRFQFLLDSHLLILILAIVVLVFVATKKQHYSWRAFGREFLIPLTAFACSCAFLGIAGVNAVRAYWVIFIMIYIILIGMLDKLSVPADSPWLLIPICFMLCAVGFNFSRELKPCKQRLTAVHEMLQQSREHTLREGKYYLWNRTGSSQKAFDIPMKAYGYIPAVAIPDFYQVPEVRFVPAKPYLFLQDELPADSTLNGFPMVDNYVIFPVSAQDSAFQSLTLCYDSAPAFVLRYNIRRIVSLCKWDKIANLRLNSRPSFPLANLLFVPEQWTSTFYLDSFSSNIETVAIIETKGNTYIAISRELIQSPSFLIKYDF